MSERNVYIVSHVAVAVMIEAKIVLSFEQEKWSALEIEAINRYLETALSPMKVLLDGAMTSITNEWSRLQTQTAKTPITSKCGVFKWHSR